MIIPAWVIEEENKNKEKEYQERPFLEIPLEEYPLEIEKNVVESNRGVVIINIGSNDDDEEE